MEKSFKSLKYLPKAITSLSFLIFLLAIFFLFQGRKHEYFRIANIDAYLPDFYTHISNFSISCLLYAGIGYFWLMAGLRFKYIIGLGIAVLASNFIYEMFIGILNTPDIIDAYYGAVGTAFAFLFLLITWKYGLKPNPNVNNADI
ncbi:hypothetical protein QRD02_11260 [Aequorivita sp. SDUM287046]|uniref:VanZ-like domain-containing protein n=1 Tax=Aequorivita aurantiaca TaxID=3053356 RepID=A0ABT8DJH3_9FLAO|nr:hypothetical protein [Aequorivita aurantiaca]MDN3724964.1 hypothetical protein [Aequorivita aurantiaca]